MKIEQVISVTASKEPSYSPGKAYVVSKFDLINNLPHLIEKKWSISYKTIILPVVLYWCET
jgi:hypothetical protein